MKNKLIKLAIYSIALSAVLTAQNIRANGDSMIILPGGIEAGSSEQQDNDTIVYRSGESDTTTIRIGGRTIRLIEKDGSTDVTIMDREETRRRDAARPRPFRGNWKGFELGLNNYVNSDFSVSLEPGADFMELHTSRSWNANLNFMQYDLTISRNNIGLVTGLGLEMNNYRFSNNNSITKQDRMIVPVNYDALGINLNKSRLRTYYLTVPLLLEFQTNHARQSHRAYFSAGVIGGVNIGSNTRVVYRDNSGRNRDKIRDDFYLSPFRYGFTVRTGIRSLNLYANYYPTSLFQKNKGPELYPIAVGISIF
jgi:hypothetical protein